MKITKELLEKYAEGKCTEEERRAIENWIPDDSDLSMNLNQKDSEREEEKVWNQLMENDPNKVKNWETLTKQTINRRPTFRYKALHYAAAIALFISLGTAIYLFITSTNNQEPETILAMEDYQNIDSKRGERLTLTLPDNSTVHLNSESHLKFPERFSDTERVVYLEGHAYFDVARNPDKPFIIYTEDTKTQVLGTSFDINTSKKEGATEIIVTSGKVAFSEKDQTDNLVTLTVNDRAVLLADGNIAIDEVDALTRTAWTKNQLIFENQKLIEIMKVAEGWFDVNVKIDDAYLSNRSFTYEAQNPSLKEFLEFMSEVAKFEYHISDKDVTISSSSFEGK